jgi:HSP20 family protein
MARQELQARAAQEKRERWILPYSCIRETDNGTIEVVLEMPGVPRENLSILVEDGELRVTGKRAEAKASGEHLLHERREGSFSRTFTLDDTVNPDSIEAAMANGVLTVRLQRKEADKPRQIAVKAG